MAATPPPPGRVRTPPPPLHGPRYDNYEPYSPRRSTRVAAQRSTDHSFSSSRSARASTPVNNHKRRSPSPASDSDTDVLPSKLGRLKPSSADSFGMLHTPAKTPRKRAVPHGAMTGTARALFPGRPATIEEAMPTPKKARKKAFNPFAIAEDAQGASSSKIEIYTDSKDRVPTLDEDEANPFLSRNAAKPNKRRKNKASEKEEDMDEAVRNDEGLVYVFRGKKTLRRFDNDDANDDEDDNLSDLEVRRKAGASASKRFTRSTIKPRLLFPSEEQRRAREAAEEADEEAVTDIEVPQPKAVTPVKQHFQPTTPPSTGRSKRGSAITPEEVDTSAAIKATKKISPFGGWGRRKPAPSSTAPAASKKREGELLEGEAKRTRSGAS